MVLGCAGALGLFLSNKFGCVRACVRACVRGLAADFRVLSRNRPTGTVPQLTSRQGTIPEPFACVAARDSDGARACSQLTVGDKRVLLPDLFGFSLVHSVTDMCAARRQPELCALRSASPPRARRRSGGRRACTRSPCSSPSALAADRT